MSNGARTIKARIEGVADMLMHNGQLADPTNAYTKKMKALTSAKKKTEDQHVEIGRIEFLGSLYWDEELGVYIPAEALSACLITGAKRNKQGTAFKSAVFVNDDSPLSFGFKPKKIDDLWDEDGTYRDVRGVKVGMSRVMRTRPRFKAGWSVDFDILLLDGAEINPSDAEKALVNAGLFAGLGDFRPQFGRFKVTKFEVGKSL